MTAAAIATMVEFIKAVRVDVSVIIETVVLLIPAINKAISGDRINNAAVIIKKRSATIANLLCTIGAS